MDLRIPSPFFRGRHHLSYFAVMLGIAIFLVKGHHDEHAVLQLRDFKQPYASARCLTHDCDPYSETDTRSQFIQSGGVDDDEAVFRPFSALYPPFSLLPLAP